eukprot:1091145-Rhodomonas_salina.1
MGYPQPMYDSVEQQREVQRGFLKKVSNQGERGEGEGEQGGSLSFLSPSTSYFDFDARPFLS